MTDTAIPFADAGPWCCIECHAGDWRDKLGASELSIISNAVKVRDGAPDAPIATTILGPIRRHTINADVILLRLSRARVRHTVKWVWR